MTTQEILEMIFWPVQYLPLVLVTAGVLYFAWSYVQEKRSKRHSKRS